MSGLVAREAAVSATVREWQGKPFRLGRNDCGRLAASHVKRLGHAVSLRPFGLYKTAKAAAAALGKNGFATVFDAVDTHFERIGFARVLPGDLIGFPSKEAEGIGGLGVWIGNGVYLGFGADAPFCATYRAVETPLAWRVPV